MRQRFANFMFKRQNPQCSGPSQTLGHARLYTVKALLRHRRCHWSLRDMIGMTGEGAVGRGQRWGDPCMISTPTPTHTFHMRSPMALTLAHAWVTCRTSDLPSILFLRNCFFASSYRPRPMPLSVPPPPSLVAPCWSLPLPPPLETNTPSLPNACAHDHVFLLRSAPGAVGHKL